jgi:hypothetical protein
VIPFVGSLGIHDCNPRMVPFPPFSTTVEISVQKRRGAMSRMVPAGVRS